MIFRIPAGHHRARPLRFGLWWRRSSFAWVVKFTDSCRYDLGNEDQFDTNKLVGIGYLPGHHKDSARFGWRYDIDKGQIEIMAYCYVKGKRVIQSICFCEIGKEYVLQLKVLATCYYLDVHRLGEMPILGHAWIDQYHNKQLKYQLGSFFGGNQPAPHLMTIELKRG